MDVAKQNCQELIRGRTQYPPPKREKDKKIYPPLLQTDEVKMLRNLLGAVRELVANRDPYDSLKESGFWSWCQGYDEQRRQDVANEAAREEAKLKAQKDRSDAQDTANAHSKAASGIAADDDDFVRMFGSV